MSRLTLLLSFATAGVSAQAAGTVNVSFQAPDKYTDFARFPVDVDTRVNELRTVLTRAAQRHLHDGQSLDIEVLDVDLAGFMAPGPSTREVRIVQSTDWSRLHLRYTYRDGQAAPVTGDEWLDSRDQMWHEESGAFDNEGRLFERWFEKRFEGKK